MEKKSSNDLEFKTFGFVSAELRRGFVVTVVAAMFCVIIFLASENRDLNNKLVQAKQEQLENEALIYQKMLNYFEPKFNSIDSTAVRVKKTMENQDSIQISILHKLNKTQK